jgi:calcium/calmodulin-dependent protein kinase I
LTGSVSALCFNLLIHRSFKLQSSIGNSAGISKLSSNSVPDRVPSMRTLARHYKLGEILGEGGYSVVKRGMSNHDRSKVAVKIVLRAGLSEEHELALRREVAILQKLKHKNIVEAKDFFEEEKCFYLVLEYLDGGELFDRIVKKTYYSEKDARDLVLVVLGALKYCHDINIVHRDLKPENLLLTSKSEDADVKLADFGFAVEAEGFTIKG